MTKTPLYEDVAKQICYERNYTYVKFVDSGAFKETYQVSYGKESYALKVFFPKNCAERTKREIGAMKMIICDSVAKLIDVGETLYGSTKYLFLIEEFLEGGSLGAYIENCLLSHNDGFAVGKSIIQALHETYSHDLVHRDIKPDNILFRSQHSDAVLVDFGLVRNLSKESLTKTFLIHGPGTPYFSAPEQLNNDKDLIDWRTDQFSLAVTLCVSMFGFHPFEYGTNNLALNQVTAREQCTMDAKNAIRQSGFLPLLKMLEPYPIGRYRLPSELLTEWNSIRRII